jgi:hypothetical protein
MRFLMMAIVGLAAATAANAAPWTDPSGTISLDAPAGWTVEPVPTDGLTHIVAASAASECHVIGVPRASTVDTPAYRMWSAAQEALPRDTWMQVASFFPDMFGAHASVQNASVDTDRYWPVQRAAFGVPGGTNVKGAIQFRPGLEIWGLCRARAGQAEESAAFEALFRSIGTPNDATLQAQSEEGRRGAQEQAERRRDTALGNRGPIGSSWTNTTN